MKNLQQPPNQKLQDLQKHKISDQIQVVSLQNSQLGNLCESEIKTMVALYAILEKMPTLLEFYSPNQQASQNVLCQPYKSTKSNRKSYHQQNRKNKLSLQITKIIESVGQAFQIYNLNGGKISDIMEKQVKLVCQTYDSIIQNINEMNDKLRQEVDHDLFLTHLKAKGIQKIIKQTKRKYVRMIKYKYIHHQNDQYSTPLKKEKQQKMFSKYFEKSTKRGQSSDEKEFIKYVLSQVQKIKQYHDSQRNSLLQTLEQKQEELSKFKLQIANLLNKNQELYQDINQLEESLNHIKLRSYQQSSINIQYDRICDGSMQIKDLLQFQTIKKEQKRSWTKEMDKLANQVKELKIQLAKVQQKQTMNNSIEVQQESLVQQVVDI